ncbi:MAG: hypothetical protein V1725_07090 [archaeon]
MELPDSKLTMILTADPSVIAARPTLAQFLKKDCKEENGIYTMTNKLSGKRYARFQNSLFLDCILNGDPMFADFLTIDHVDVAQGKVKTFSSPHYTAHMKFSPEQERFDITYLTSAVLDSHPLTDMREIRFLQFCMYGSLATYGPGGFMDGIVEFYPCPRTNGTSAEEAMLPSMFWPS